MKILVCGGRKFSALPMRQDGNGPDKDHPDYPARLAELYFIYKKLDEVAGEVHPEYPSEAMQLPEDVEIISGKATGADMAAIEWAIMNWVPFKEFPADWDRYGNSAGPIRNQRMLDEGKPDLVLAFPGGAGTADMTRKSKTAGIEVRQYEYRI